MQCCQQSFPLPKFLYQLHFLTRALRSPVTELLRLVARKFLFCAISSSVRELTRIQLLLVICMCNERRSFSRHQFVSLQLMRSELLNEQIHCLFARRNVMPNILETVLFLSKCGQNSSSQHTFRECIFTVLRQFVF